MNKKQKIMLARIIASGAIMAVLTFAPEGSIPIAAMWAGYIASYIIIGHDILRRALHGLMNRQISDENFLMAVATLGAIALAAYSDGDCSEAVAVMLFYQIGELFQSVAVGRSRRNISDLMDIRPDHANIERDGAIEEVDPDEVEVGTIIVVRPGEKVPIDGVVVEGVSALSTAALTGESVPRDVEPGSEVISGCVCLNGLIKIRTTKEFGESTASKILDLVENASSRKSEPEKFISRFARIYTPVVCVLALLLAVAPPAVHIAIGEAPEWSVWIYRALTFLVMSCPCALVVSIPLSFFGGIGGASSRGVLVKGSNYLEAMSRASTIVMDKTGTLTRGEFSVRETRAAALDAPRLLELAAHAESASSHPIAKSIIRAYGQAIDGTRVSDIREKAGGGTTANVDGVSVSCGNAGFIGSLGVDVPDTDAAGGTIVHVAADGKYAGALIIADTAKPTSADAVRAMHDMGIKVVMLTGDSRAAAASIANELGIKDVRSELLPQDKVSAVETMLAERTPKEQIVFVGDGINDAPVLTRADVGVAMGAMGSDAAIEAADVVLMDDDPMKIVTAIKISRKCLSVVHQNTWASIGIKVVCLVLGAMGLAGMWAAIFADVGMTVLAVMNSARTLFVKDL